MKRLCLIFCLLTLSFTGYGQFIGDTVIVYVDNLVEIKVAIRNFEELKESDSALNILDEFQQLFPEIKNELSADGSDLINYSEIGTLTIEPGDPKTIFLSKDGKMTNTGTRDQVILQKDELTIFITSADISAIEDLQLSNCIKGVITKLPNQIRWPKTLIYECVNGKIIELENKNNAVDMLELNFGAGAGLIKSKWVTDLSFGLRLGLNHKGLQRGPYVSSNMIFDFSEESSMHINTFLNAGYAWSLEGLTKQPTMLEVELGYLISKQGDLFGDNTFRLGANWSPVGLLQVSPQLYITDDFNQVYPGFRIGIRF